MVLPSGFEIPPLPYLLVVLVAAGLVGYGLWRARPTVDDRTVLALAPWIVVGSSLYACYQVGVVPAVLAPLASSPVVYLSTFALAGAVWLAALRLSDRPHRTLAVVGALVLVVPVAAALAYGAQSGSLRLLWPLVALVVAAVLSAAVWLVLGRVRPDTVAVTGAVGALAVFGHALDGVSTAVGVDVLGFAEQTPISRLIMHAAAGLPTASVLGVGWLFVLVKVALAVVVVALFTEYVREEPTEGFLLVGLVAAVGLGPGAHNLLLYAITQPATF